MGNGVSKREEKVTYGRSRSKSMFTQRTQRLQLERYWIQATEEAERRYV